jgi:RING finger protein 121
MNSDFWILTIFYSVLGRDFVEICTDRMAATIGYYSEDGLPNKYLGDGVCAVCGHATSSSKGHVSLHNDPAVRPMFSDDPVHQLTCKHVFHEKCIRGWVMIGKKDICPYW